MPRGPVQNFDVKKIGHSTITWSLVLLCTAATLSQQKTTPITGDGSDWWSEVTDLGNPVSIKTQQRQVGLSTLEVASVKAGLGAIARAADKFGQTTVVARGDAAESRSQACYISGDADAYLIFEEDGEGFGGAFYLFNRGRDWNGSQFCAKLSLNSMEVRTKSGLHLGMSPTDVETILGRPSTASVDALTYAFEVKKKTSFGEMNRFRTQNPGLSESRLQEDFGFYYVQSSVVARFSASKLIYLAVTEYESLP